MDWYFLGMPSKKEIEEALTLRVVVPIEGVSGDAPAAMLVDAAGEGACSSANLYPWPKCRDPTTYLRSWLYEAYIPDVAFALTPAREVAVERIVLDGNHQHLHYMVAVS